jgi:hypothetical protein
VLLHQIKAHLTTVGGKKKGFALQSCNTVWFGRIDGMGKPLFYNEFTYEQAGF